MYGGRRIRREKVYGTQRRRTAGGSENLRLKNETGHGRITVYQVFLVLSFTITICTWDIAIKIKPQLKT